MAFNPTTLFPGAAGDREGAILEIRPENLWQDEAGTTAVTTDGDPVRRYVDTSVNGHDFVIDDTNNPFIYKTDGTVHWLQGGDIIGFVSVDNWSWMDNAPYAVCAAVSFDAPSSGDQYFFGTFTASGGGGRNGGTVHCGARTSTTATIAHWNDDQDFTHTFPTDTAERHICEYKNPGSEYTVDGSQIDVSATTPSDLDGVVGATIMCRLATSSTAHELDGNLYGMIIIIDTITAQERADIDEWLQEQIEGPADQTVVVGQAAVIDSATAILTARTELVLQATEEDIARAVVANRAVALGQAAEASAAALVAISTAKTAMAAQETDVATAVGRLRTLGVGLSTVTDTATASTPLRALAVGVAGEASAATSLGHGRLAVVELATESDTAGGVVATGGAEPESGGGDFWIIRRRRRWV